MFMHYVYTVINSCIVIQYVCESPYVLFPWFLRACSCDNYCIVFFIFWFLYCPLLGEQWHCIISENIYKL